MFVELPKTHYRRVEELFAPLSFNVEVPSILQGNTRGVIYVDSIEKPRQALMWDHLMAIYLAGQNRESEFATGIRDWLMQAPVPQAQKYGIEALTVDATPDLWNGTLPRLLNDFRLTRDMRHCYAHTGTRARFSEVSSEYTIQPVSPQLLTRDDLVGRGWLEGWISSYWPTLAQFFELGIGYVALLEDRAVASLCVSVFVSGKTYEFGTATLEEHRNRGLSTAVAGNCINRCLARELRPVWHCWADNLPSIAVAEKVGFELEREYAVTKVWVPSTAT